MLLYFLFSHLLFYFFGCLKCLIINNKYILAKLHPQMKTHPGGQCDSSLERPQAGDSALPNLRARAMVVLR